MVWKQGLLFLAFLKKLYQHSASFLDIYKNKYIQIQTILFVFMPIIHNTMAGKQTNIIFVKNVEYMT